MKFKLAKGFEAAEVAAGTQIYRVDLENPEISTWDLDGISALRGRPGIVEVEESAGEVVAAIPELTDRELKTVLIFDQRDSVQKAGNEEQTARRDKLAAELEQIVSQDAAARRAMRREQLLAELDELNALDEFDSNGGDES